MLILTRRPGETIMIGDNIAVTVQGVLGSQVKIAVNAPKEVAVHREEVYERIQAGSPSTVAHSKSQKKRLEAQTGRSFELRYRHGLELDSGEFVPASELNRGEK